MEALTAGLLFSLLLSPCFFTPPAMEITLSKLADVVPVLCTVFLAERVLRLYEDNNQPTELLEKVITKVLSREGN